MCNRVQALHCKAHLICVQLCATMKVICVQLTGRRAADQLSPLSPLIVPRYPLLLPFPNFFQLPLFFFHLLLFSFFLSSRPSFCVIYQSWPILWVSEWSRPTWSPMALLRLMITTHCPFQVQFHALIARFITQNLFFINWCNTLLISG